MAARFYSRVSKGMRHAPAVVDLLWLVLGLVLLYYGAEGLVKGAKDLSLRFGISPLVVGLTVVAFGTSAPELLVSLQANLKDPPKGDMALGNVVGSNICNIALILAVGALIRPIVIHLQIVKREMPFLLLISAVFVFFLEDKTIARWEGGVLFAGVLFYTFLNFRKARQEPDSVTLDEISDDDEGEESSLVKDIFFIVIGMAGLVIGADRLVFGGSNLAERFGVSEATIALTVVAFGTSLPELATSVVAAIRRQGDLITGNAVGSCIFNLLCVVGIVALVAPISRTPELHPADLIVMLAITVTIFPFMWSRRRLSRIEGGVLLAVYLGYVAHLATR